MSVEVVWTPRMDARVRWAKGRTSVKLVAAELGLRPAQVQRRREELGSLARPEWTQSQVRLLVKLHGLMPMKVVARRVGKPVGACYSQVSRLRQLGMLVGGGRWTQPELDYLGSVCPLGAVDLARLPGRTPDAVRKMYYDLRAARRKPPKVANLRGVQRKARVYARGTLSVDEIRQLEPRISKRFIRRLRRKHEKAS
jgi:DNA-binding Lrp family transcriptional regulator